MNPNPQVLAKEFVKTNLIPQNFRLRRKPKNIDFSVLNLRIATHPPPPRGVVIFTKTQRLKPYVWVGTQRHKRIWGKRAQRAYRQKRRRRKFARFGLRETHFPLQNRIPYTYKPIFFRLRRAISPTMKLYCSITSSVSNLPANTIRNRFASSGRKLPVDTIRIDPRT